MQLRKSRFGEDFWWPEGDLSLRYAENMGDLATALKYVCNRSLAFQAGGNCGVWASELAKRFDEVWTVEPDLENYLCLVRNVPANVRTIWAALGSEPGSTGLHRQEHNNCGTGYPCGSGRIPIITIDELDLPACDLLILDIEGYETQALAGAKRTLEKFKPVLEIEDTGNSVKFGVKHGWTKDFDGYSIVKNGHKDVILLPN